MGEGEEGIVLLLLRHQAIVSFEAEDSRVDLRLVELVGLSQASAIDERLEDRLVLGILEPLLPSEVYDLLLGLADRE